MASALQRLLGAIGVTTQAEGQIHVFGVRHLSPGGAWHLRRFLDRIQPQLVLVEGPADAVDLTEHWVKKATKPPIALLAYTADLPVRTFVYPIASYSPEYQAVLWAHQHQAALQFIDLPSDVFLALHSFSGPPNGPLDPTEPSRPSNPSAERDTANHEADDNDDEDHEEEAAAPAIASGDSDSLDRLSIYEQVARRSGEKDYEAYWERHFEHNLNDEAFRRAAYELGQALRDLDLDPVRRQAECLVREAYMRRCIEEAIASGVDPQRIVAVVGAFHAPVLDRNLPAMTADELARLPRRPSKLTMMPYSYFRLSSQSGYGAGNHAPAYFELMWDALQHDELPHLAHRYLSLVARQVRQSGTHRSTAEVIEGVRLARTLAALHEGSAPTLADLHDAAVTLLGHGERAPIAEPLASIDVGTAIGELPEGVSRTSIQDDFDRELRQLKLEKYRSTVRQNLDLDLRENRQAKTATSAFLDLHRSTFLHRLRILGVPFASELPSQQQSATWSEKWELQWSPECEIVLVESVLLGETIELAAAYKFAQAIEQSTAIEATAGLLRDACQCGLLETMEVARRRLQELSAESSAFVAIASAAAELMLVVRYGDVRKHDTSSLIPLIEALFVQGCLALYEAANCDANAAKEMVGAIDRLNRVALEFHTIVDEPLWQRELKELSDADKRNPLLSGTACALLLERGWMTNEQLAREVSRRLSPGISADLGAGWFEGLASRNRYALLARQVLWEYLAEYVTSLDEDQFRRSLVFLRRAFGCFGPQEKRTIVENLGNVWGVEAEAIGELLDGALSANEEQAIADLNEFDFGDL